jgi:hypothetical protein
MIDLHAFAPETVFIAGTILGLLLGSFVAALILGALANRRQLKARCRAFREAENLYLTGRARDFRA